MKTIELGTARTPRLGGNSVESKRAELKSYFRQTWDTYDALFSVIRDDDAYYLRAEPLRHPLIFYYAHTATFFMNKLLLGKCIEERINENFESMFAIGVDEMSWDDLNDAHYDWPKVREVRHYREKVRERVERLIDTMPLELPIRQDSPAWIVLMGTEHERIHIETSSVIIRMLPLDRVQPSDLWKACSDHGPAPENGWRSFQAQSVRLGKPDGSDIYGWDNEYGSRVIEVSEFRAATHLVSNEEYKAFIEAGGYHRQDFWTEEGRAWLAYTKAEMPRFWVSRDDSLFQRNLTEEIELPLNWPVEVNYLEAKAFCNWKSSVKNTNVRLPTEAEWSCIRDLLPGDHPGWEKSPGNLNLEGYASSCPVDRFETDGMFDIVGNVWQWTETAIDGYHGFQVHELYDDFSTPTFDGKHNLFKGGSWISTGNLATRHSRYAFRRHFFQHAGFRYIESDSAVVPTEDVNIYETDSLISQYLEFHYGAQYFDVPNYPVACVDACMEFAGEAPRRRALDLGSSVGRSTFELARYYDHVDGIDFSARFIQHALQLKENGRVRFTIPTEGDLVEYKEVALADFGYETISEKTDFIQGDACNLKPRFRDYDLIFCGNLIDRLYDPALFLNSIGERVVPGGLLVLTSPYTWLEEYTNKDKWLGGLKVRGENQSTLEGLREALKDRFEWIEARDVEFVIRETGRKFQHTVAQMTVWRKRGD
jgi:5-histidylcysteine sulfoxide synthase/putative 4-mercaptohistidine N1-methyltranferase